MMPKTGRLNTKAYMASLMLLERYRISEQRAQKMLFSTVSLQRWIMGAATAILAFAALGTVSALWENPLFVRMTSAGGWEIGLLGALSALLGLYVAIRRPTCSNSTAGAGGLIGFLGVACPVCNKVLLLAFGSELLLTYFEPIRPYVAAAGVAIVGLAVLHEWRRPGPQTQFSVADHGR